MLGRIILATAALLLAAMTAVELRAELDYQDGQELLFAGGDVEQARHSLERADDFRPGTSALVARAFLEKRAGRRAEAEALAREATDREPENVATWHALLSTSRDADERALAQEQILLLDPRSQ